MLAIINNYLYLLLYTDHQPLLSFRLTNKILIENKIAVIPRKTSGVLVYPFPSIFKNPKQKSFTYKIKI